MSMTAEEVAQAINAAPIGQALSTARRLIKKLTRDERVIAAGDLESMAILRDQENDEDFPSPS